MDVEMAGAFNLDRDLYLKMLYLKTATLIESCAYCAALLEGKDAQVYGLYGKNLGLAFQIVDDILDIIGDEKMLGKPALNDFVEGKTTLPYIDLHDVLDDSGKAKLIGCHGRVLEASEKQWLSNAMQEHGIIARSYARAQELCDEALSVIGDEDALRAIITTVIQRSH